MCGINGIFAYDDGAPAADIDELRRTQAHMAVRGPDGVGEWRSEHGRIAFAHRRLAIIDPRPEGAQPLYLFTFSLGIDDEDALGLGRQ